LSVFRLCRFRDDRNSRRRQLSPSPKTVTDPTKCITDGSTAVLQTGIAIMLLLLLLPERAAKGSRVSDQTRRASCSRTRLRNCAKNKGTRPTPTRLVKPSSCAFTGYSITMVAMYEMETLEMYDKIVKMAQEKRRLGGS
jgi:hypothetical protein